MKCFYHSPPLGPIATPITMGYSFNRTPVPAASA